MKNLLKATRVVSVLMILAAVTGCALLFPYRLGSYKGKVIDKETGKPIEGAVVYAIYISRSASPAGMLSAYIDYQETLTDKNGEFVISEKKAKDSKHYGLLDGRLRIFKPGYGTLDNRKTRWTCEESKEVGCWIRYDTYILFELPELKNKEERKLNLRTAEPTSFIPYKKQKLLIKAFDEERVFLNLEPFSLPVD